MKYDRKEGEKGKIIVQKSMHGIVEGVLPKKGSV